ncbi:hypothetical protein GDO81_006361 [Engystomops pustulosus]|uniref:Uncharacterized protein n=1 Tax=Engystomops pustulosus TaxID=76066 RepID=A0AAV7CZA8_ENGPU|nr:hypothetical protein GDO81_006361 [Engystomops pustulosus]
MEKVGLEGGRRLAGAGVHRAMGRLSLSNEEALNPLVTRLHHSVPFGEAAVQTRTHVSHGKYPADFGFRPIPLITVWVMNHRIVLQDIPPGMSPPSHYLILFTPHIVTRKKHVTI